MEIQWINEQDIRGQVIESAASWHLRTGEQKRNVETDSSEYNSARRQNFGTQPPPG